MDKSGVYEILNTSNGKRYVGSAVNLKKRLTDHASNLRCGRHTNIHLQRSWDKCGEDTFEFEVLEYWEPEFLISMEQWWMNMLRPEYNIAPVAGNCLGMKHTAETKAKISAAGIGRKATDETKAKISAANKGRKFTDEHKAKISAAGMGNPKFLGHKHTAKTKAKMSKAQMGNQNLLGHKHTDETKAKISAAQLGSKDSAQTKAKKKAAAIKAWARRKAKGERS